MPFGDGVRPTERVADVEHRRHGQALAGVGHRVAVEREPVGAAAEPEHELAVTHAIAVRRRPRAAGEQLHVSDGRTVMRREERDDVFDGPNVHQAATAGSDPAVALRPRSDRTETGGFTKRVRAVGALPREVAVLSAKVPICSGFCVNRPPQVEVAEDRCRPQVEVLAHELLDPQDRNRLRPERLYKN